MSRLIHIVFFVLLHLSALPAVAQPTTGTAAASTVEDVVMTIKGQLNSQYVVARTNSEGTDLVAAGTVLALRKENLIMTKALSKNGQRSVPVQNVYESGKIGQSGILGTLSKLNSFLGGSNADITSRAFDLGTKIWVTNISVQTSGVEFLLMSDPINEERFHGVLRFPMSNSATADHMVGVISQVLPPDQTPTGVANTPSATPVVDDALRIRQVAETGDPEAMYQWANVLAQRGENVEAVRWFERASDKGHATAANALGFMCEEGRGVPQDLTRANALYFRAMKAGDAVAMINRGLMILNGKGVGKDPQQAYMHFLLAVKYARDDGARGAANKLKGDAAARLTKQQIARGQTMADKFSREQMK